MTHMRHPRALLFVIFTMCFLPAASIQAEEDDKIYKLIQDETVDVQKVEQTWTSEKASREKALEKPFDGRSQDFEQKQNELLEETRAKASDAKARPPQDVLTSIREKEKERMDRIEDVEKSTMEAVRKESRERESFWSEWQKEREASFEDKVRQESQKIRDSKATKK